MKTALPPVIDQQLMTHMSGKRKPPAIESALRFFEPDQRARAVDTDTRMRKLLAQRRHQCVEGSHRGTSLPSSYGPGN